VRDAVANGRGLGPRLLLAGIVDGTGPSAIGVERVDTPEQAKLWTDKYHDAGFQQMKIYSFVKLEDVKDVAEEAHRLGMTVTGHVPIGLNAYQTIEVGQDQINHIPYIVDIVVPPLPADASRLDHAQARANLDLNSPDAQKAIAFLVQHGTVVDPTLALFEFFSASTAKPAASIEPGVLKVAPELQAILADVGPPSPYADINEKVFAKELAVVGALHDGRTDCRRNGSDGPWAQPASRDRTVRPSRIYAHGSDSGRNNCAGARDGARQGTRHSGTGQARRHNHPRRQSARIHSQHSQSRIRHHQRRHVQLRRAMAQRRFPAVTQSVCRLWLQPRHYRLSRCGSSR
jgi:hypothetical protein